MIVKNRGGKVKSDLQEIKTGKTMAISRRHNKDRDWLHVECLIWCVCMWSFGSNQENQMGLLLSFIPPSQATYSFFLDPILKRSKVGRAAEQKTKAQAQKAFIFLHCQFSRSFFLFSLAFSLLVAESLLFACLPVRFSLPYLCVLTTSSIHTHIHCIPIH